MRTNVWKEILEVDVQVCAHVNTLYKEADVFIWEIADEIAKSVEKVCTSNNKCFIFPSARQRNDKWEALAVKLWSPEHTDTSVQLSTTQVTPDETSCDK